MFISAYCIVRAEANYSASKFHKAYCEMTGDKVSMKELNRMMLEHGYKSEHSRIGNVWIGIAPIDFDTEKDM
jgi:hypothetical protein